MDPSSEENDELKHGEEFILFSSHQENLPHQADVGCVLRLQKVTVRLIMAFDKVYHAHCTFLIRFRQLQLH